MGKLSNIAGKLKNYFYLLTMLKEIDFLTKDVIVDILYISIKKANFFIKVLTILLYCIITLI